jgi:FkbM family methyltransferase
VPKAIWSRDARVHARWTRRVAQADAADRTGEVFHYEHPRIGRFVYHPSDYLSRRIFLYDDFELGELKFAMDCARAGGIVLDVGANVGFYTAACARAAGAGGRVIAVEPGPQTFAKLAATCDRLGLSNVTLVNAAASARRGTAQFLTGPGDRDVHQHLADARAPADAGRYVRVETRTLDEICGNPGEVTLAKIDVEGHELDVLTGAPRILASRRTRLIVEVFPAALAAAGASSAALWTMLNRTHECIGMFAADGSARPPHRDTLDAEGPDGVLNTLWSPRTVS